MQKFGKISLILLAVLIAVVLFLSVMAQNMEMKSRPDGTYIKVEHVVSEKIKCEDAPTGIVSEYRFPLEEIGSADMLVFFINHNNIEVYLGEECVYRLESSEDSIQTPGGVWVMLPLYKTDIGKEVRVVLSPLYADYQDKIPNFLLGDRLAIYFGIVSQALPAILLGLCNILVGIFLLCLACYHKGKDEQVTRVYVTGMLAFSAGFWRFSYEKGTYLLFAQNSVLLFNISVISLMVIALAMLYSTKLSEDEKGKKIIHFSSIAYCIIYSIQLVLQILGVADLRQTLGVIHITIILSVAFLFGGSLYGWKRNIGKEQRGYSYFWLTGVGVLMDLLLYYFADTSVGMLFTLSAILVFSMLEGFAVLNSYKKQKIMLEEMKTQLTLSKTTIMISQIRSHFVFNLLNAISGMCKYDPQKADDTVVRFARYLRNNIDIMENDKNIPFLTCLQRLEDYVALEQVRFGDKVEFYTDIEITDFMIPPLILQPVVENAIKHGISKKKGNGTIILSTCLKEETVIITVEDDGVGFDMEELSKEKSVGLKNIRFRLEHLVNGTFEIFSEVNKGTTVTITIPRNDGNGCSKTRAGGRE